MQHICIAKNTLHSLCMYYCSHSHLAAHLGIYSCTLSEFCLCLLTGQFWNIPLKIEPYVGQYGERLVDLMDRFYSLTVSYPNVPERGSSLPSMMSETGLTTDPASMLAMPTVGVSVRSPLLAVSLKAQLAAMLCRICSALTSSSSSTTEIADGDGFCVGSLPDNFAVLDNHPLLLNRLVDLDFLWKSTTLL